MNTATKKIATEKAMSGEVKRRSIMKCDAPHDIAENKKLGNKTSDTDSAGKGRTVT